MKESVRSFMGRVRTFMGRVRSFMGVSDHWWACQIMKGACLEVSTNIKVCRWGIVSKIQTVQVPKIVRFTEKREVKLPQRFSFLWGPKLSIIWLDVGVIGSANYASMGSCISHPHSTTTNSINTILSDFLFAKFSFKISQLDLQSLMAEERL